MASKGEAIAQRARALIGAPYRPQGRRAQDGLDCVGVAAAALGLDGETVTRAYQLRGSTYERLAGELQRHGLVEAADAAMQPGDLLIFRPGAAQLHLAIFTFDRFVHADAGLRSVVERPLPAPWPLAGLWRAADAP